MIPSSTGRQDLDPAPADETPRWLLALESAHDLALRAGRALETAPPSGADLRPAARAIEDAIASIYAAIDGSDDGALATRAAASSLDLAGKMLAPFLGLDAALPLVRGWFDEARAALAVAEERFSRVAPEPPPAPFPLRASKDVPTLHRLDREAISPILRVAEPLKSPPEDPPALPPPASVAELRVTLVEVRRRAEEARADRRAREDARARARAEKKAKAIADENAEPLPGFARGRFVALSPGAQIAERTRECFEEVAMIGVQRAPLLGDPWRVARVLEDRILASIDAVAAMGSPALDHLEPLVLDAPAKDPSRGFALTMILGCIDGRDCLGAVERVLHHLGPADPETARHVGGALKLIPHPSLPRLLRGLLASTDPACRAIAIDVLAYRGLATSTELAAAASDPSPLVAAAALPPLALALPDGAGTALEPARDHDDPLLREAAWLAMLYGNHPHLTEVLTAELDGPRAHRAALPLAIAGNERDAARLIDLLRASPTPSLVTAVGWAGSPDGVPLLIDLLGHEDPVIQLGAAYALDRLTGARLYDTVELPPEAIDVPDVEEPDVGEPKGPSLSRMVSDSRDRPSEGAGDTATLPTIRADRWRAYWIEKGASYRLTARYRRGSPYTPTVSLWELDTWPVTPVERRWLQRELVVRTGQLVRFDPHDFVAVQELALQAWAPVAQRMSGSPGAWARPMRR
jgi:hypothetical protein